MTRIRTLREVGRVSEERLEQRLSNEHAKGGCVVCGEPAGHDLFCVLCARKRGGLRTARREEVELWKKR